VAPTGRLLTDDDRWGRSTVSGARRRHTGTTVTSHRTTAPNAGPSPADTAPERHLRARNTECLRLSASRRYGSRLGQLEAAGLLASASGDNDTYRMLSAGSRRAIADARFRTPPCERRGAPGTALRRRSRGRRSECYRRDAFRHRRERVDRPTPAFVSPATANMRSRQRS